MCRLLNQLKVKAAFDQQEDQAFFSVSYVPTDGKRTQLNANVAMDSSKSITEVVLGIMWNFRLCCICLLRKTKRAEGTPRATISAQTCRMYPVWCEVAGRSTFAVLGWPCQESHEQSCWPLCGQSSHIPSVMADLSCMLAPCSCICVCSCCLRSSWLVR